MFIKIFVIPFLLQILLYSSTYNLKEIQQNFHNKVVLEPLFLNQYKKSIDTICGDDITCYPEKFTKLIKNNSIKNLLNRRDRRFTLSQNYLNKVYSYLNKKQKHFSSSQFITLVDLSNQVLAVILWDNKTKTFQDIGFDFISSGDINREIEVTNGEDHYLKTPAGFFSIHSGWRSKGKIYDDKITMPYGKKDSYVFYFGTQKSIRYNTFDKNGKKIKDKKKWKLINDKLEFAMHAHKSSSVLGEVRSHGCIRMTNELNFFLDNNLVFFKHLYNEKKEWLHPYKKPPTNPQNHELAGKYMIVVDEL